MSVDKSASDFFVAGGTLHPDVSSYVKRPADDELFELALAGEFCYVLTPRQMGKSSLMVRTDRRLREDGVSTAIVDLTRSGFTGVSAEQWYLSLLSQLKRRLRLAVDPVAWWEERASLGYVQRFTDFLRDVVLTEVEGQVVVFVDEIDTTLNLDFRGDFFAAVRAVYNARAHDPAFQRLTFVLLGVASPTDLTKDVSLTPFNIGHALALQEFSRADASVLRDGLEALYPGQGDVIFGRIYHWTDGHPYLTQRLCLAAAEGGARHWTDDRVDGLVERLFLSEEARRETNLQFVQNRILTHPQRNRLLALYKRIASGKVVREDGQSQIQSQLKLSGLVKARNGQLRVRNEIYRRVWGLAWVKENVSVNRWRIAANVSILLSVLMISLIAYNFWVGVQLKVCVANFYETDDPDEQTAQLARIIRLWSPFTPRDFDDRAEELFLQGLTPEERIALFDEDDPRSVRPELLRLVRGTYVQFDNTPLNNKLLTAMARTLRAIDDPDAVALAALIDQWLDAREAYGQANYVVALGALGGVLASNPENVEAYIDRALVYAQTEAYEEALIDLAKALQLDQSKATRVRRAVNSDPALAWRWKLQSAQYPELNPLASALAFSSYVIQASASERTTVVASVLDPEGKETCSDSLVLEPGESYKVSMEEICSGRVYAGSVAFSADQTVAAVYLILVDELPEGSPSGKRMHIAGFGEGSSQLFLPSVEFAANSSLTGLSIMNTEWSDLNVQVHLLDRNGRVFVTRRLALPPHGSSVLGFSDMREALSDVPGWFGAAHIVAEGGLTVATSSNCLASFCLGYAGIAGSSRHWFVPGLATDSSDTDAQVLSVFTIMNASQTDQAKVTVIFPGSESPTQLILDPLSSIEMSTADVDDLLPDSTVEILSEGAEVVVGAQYLNYGSRQGAAYNGLAVDQGGERLYLPEVSWAKARQGSTTIYVQNLTSSAVAPSLSLYGRVTGSEETSSGPLELELDPIVAYRTLAVDVGEYLEDRGLTEWEGSAVIEGAEDMGAVILIRSNSEQQWATAYNAIVEP